MTRSLRAFVSGLAAVALVTLGVSLPAASASAEDAGDYEHLRAALAAGTSPLRLSADVVRGPGDAGDLVVADGAAVTLDLAGHDLDLTADSTIRGSLVLGAGSTLEVVNSGAPGVLVAHGADGAAAPEAGEAGIVVPGGATLRVRGAIDLDVRGGAGSAAVKQTSSFDIAKSAGGGGAGIGSSGGDGTVYATPSAKSSTSGAIDIDVDGDVTAIGGTGGNGIETMNISGVGGGGGGAGIGAGGGGGDADFASPGSAAGSSTLAEAVVLRIDGDLVAVGGSGGARAQLVGGNGSARGGAGAGIGAGGGGGAGGTQGIRRSGNGGSIAAAAIDVTLGESASITGVGAGQPGNGSFAGLVDGPQQFTDVSLRGGSVTLGGLLGVTELSLDDVAVTVAAALTIPAAATVSGTGALGGSGTVANAGIVRSTVAVDPGLVVTGNAFPVLLDAAGGSVSPASVVVYAPSLGAGGYVLPVPARADATSLGWFLGSVAFTDSIALAVVPAPIRATARWSDDTVTDPVIMTYQELALALSFAEGTPDAPTMIGLGADVVRPAASPAVIQLAAGAGVVLDLRGFTIDLTADGALDGALAIGASGALRITGAGGELIARGPVGRAGIAVPADASLLIDGDVTVTARGGDGGAASGFSPGGGGAGIGSDGGVGAASGGVSASTTSGAIVIEDAAIVATGGRGAPGTNQGGASGGGAGLGSGGVGGGRLAGQAGVSLGAAGDATTGPITISGAEVTATGGTANATGASGTAYAPGGAGGAGIGSGGGGAGGAGSATTTGEIRIESSTVVAAGGDAASSLDHLSGSGGGGAGIGSGGGGFGTDAVPRGTSVGALTIIGSDIEVSGGDGALAVASGAGSGGAGLGSGGAGGGVRTTGGLPGIATAAGIVIEGGKVVAVGGAGGASAGSSESWIDPDTGVPVTVSNPAAAGGGGAGIGTGGGRPELESLSIAGAEIDASGGSGGAGGVGSSGGGGAGIGAGGASGLAGVIRSADGPSNGLASVVHGLSLSDSQVTARGGAGRGPRADAVDGGTSGGGAGIGAGGGGGGLYTVATPGTGGSSVVAPDAADAGIEIDGGVVDAAGGVGGPTSEPSVLGAGGAGAGIGSGGSGGGLQLVVIVNGTEVHTWASAAGSSRVGTADPGITLSGEVTVTGHVGAGEVADRVVRDNSDGPAFSPGAPSGAALVAPGSRLTIDGALTITDGTTLENRGTILGTGDLTGLGTAALVNGGSVGADVEVASTLPLSGNDFEVRFVRPDGTTTVRLLAPVFDTTIGYAAPRSPDPDHVFTAWSTSPLAVMPFEFRTAEGGGDAVTGDLTLFGVLASVTEVAFPDERLPVVGRQLTGEITVTARAGGAEPEGSVSILDGDGDVVFGPESVVDGVAEVAFTPSAPGALRVVFTASDVRRWADAETATSVLSVEDAAAELDVVASTTAPKVTDTVTFTVTGFDAHGDPLGDVTSLATLSSDVPDDIVDGNTVRFTHASPHTITVTVGDATSTVLLEVADPAAGGPVGGGPGLLGATGFATGAALVVALAVLALGAVIAVVGRRLRRA